MNSNNKAWIIIGIVILILVGFSLIGTDDSDPEFVADQYNTMEEVQQDHPEIDSEFIRENFMEGCLESGVVTYKFCNCGYEYLTDNYGDNVFIEIGNDFLDGQPSDQTIDYMDEVVAACMQ
jgi:uncharacterized protein YneF (UPF0154 family)